MDKLPHFFITGTVKGGTTSLYNYLVEHPDIYMSPVKEPHFFCTDIRPENFREQYKKMINADINEVLSAKNGKKYINSAFIRDLSIYKKLFAKSHKGQVRGESSTSYLISTEAASNIREMIPQARIIIMLRDPVQRAYSHYLMNYRSGSVDGTFNEELRKDIAMQPKGWGISRLYLEHGFYYNQVKRYLDLFGRNQVKIILNEDLSMRTEKTVQETYEFLGVNKTFNGGFHERHNAAQLPSSSFSRFILQQGKIIKMASLFVPRPVRSMIYKNILLTKEIPEADSGSQSYLKEIYKDDVRKLQDLIQRDLSAWLQ
jgi:hypothetical protein